MLLSDDSLHDHSAEAEENLTFLEEMAPFTLQWSEEPASPFLSVIAGGDLHSGNLGDPHIPGGGGGLSLSQSTFAP
jgi:hypothetical protein